MEKDFGLLIQLLATFNALHEGIGNLPMFTYKIKGDIMYIESYSPTNIAGLFTTLWATTKNFTFYLEKNKIEVL